MKETENTHEIRSFVRPVDEADCPRRAVVKVPRVDIGVSEVRSRDERRHDPDDCDNYQRTTTAQSTTQRMYDHHISVFIQLRFTVSSSGGSMGVRWVRTNPSLRPDPGVVAENARTGCIRVVH